MLPDLTRRNRQPEWMDAPDADPIQLAQSLRYIRLINSFLGYTRTTLRHLDAMTHNWSPNKPLRILDVATGSADVPVAIEKWATKRGVRVQIVGVDLHERTIRTAGEARSPRVALVQGDALQLPFADRSFDIATTSLFLHHLSDGEAATVLREMSRVSAVGIIAGDLLRHRRAYAWITLFSLWANPMVRHDARVSVAQAYTKEEVLELQRAAGVEYATYHRHFGHRFVLAGRKPR